MRGSTTSSPTNPHLRRETIPLVLSASWERRCAQTRHSILLPSGAKAPIFSRHFAARINPCPFKTRLLTLAASTRSMPLDGHHLAGLQSVQVRIENHARDKYGGEKVGQQTDGQRGCKASHRAGADHEQDERRNYCRDVCINDSSPCVVKSLVHGCRGRLAGANFFSYALEDQHV